MDSLNTGPKSPSVPANPYKELFYNQLTYRRVAAAVAVTTTTADGKGHWSTLVLSSSEQQDK
jgi:hypothetical protein